MSHIAESKALKAFPLALYGIALIFDLVGIVAGIQALSTSVAGGLSVLLIGFILLALIGWRINCKKQLHTDTGQ